MDWLAILILIVAGILVLKVVGRILKFVIGIGLFLLFLYIVTQLIEAAFAWNVPLF
ncbi:hypothetical protein [Alteribacter populi]|uniref:hypothetical protein n=1 Tax=Alteribacter populi TaxID=2011011 RepID=UPI0012FD685E|nr:hypothetical protein [Alteribacter populi]